MNYTINKQTQFTPKNLIHCRDVVNYETLEDKYYKKQVNFKKANLSKGRMVAEMAFCVFCVLVFLVVVCSVFLFKGN